MKILSFLAIAKYPHFLKSARLRVYNHDNELNLTKLTKTKSKTTARMDQCIHRLAATDTRTEMIGQDGKIITGRTVYGRLHRRS